MILVRANTKKGYEVAELGDSINLEYPNSTTRRGRVGKQIAQTITTSPQQGGVVLKPTVKGVNDMLSMFLNLSSVRYLMILIKYGCERR